ncbi:VanY-A/VanY-F/VanY-M family D-Ala-D-Ala carboxypeptidase [Neobacillus massiliamazoniensis]|uniref:D-alanyl-D-alanine carboxypeptidase n=1 Tax=Neobacillus massiliamazoniensis TaxID=1499688 RepID=A0A0U1NTV2_9BACI|nr:VanY-A/VanY-F/VanY-M family D-Ala-D-Ala carboxypeptidase [Neobacillus massiliamazoniensis]CRK81168.1 D-alanyl-D-alanine carboxypeptidase [Neobacillus massiliamazoniensis]
MKKWGFLFVLLLCLGIAGVNLLPFFQDTIEINSQNDKDILGDKGMNGEFQKIEIKKEQIFQGNLLLVNNKYPVHQGSIKQDIVDLYTHKELTKGYGLLDSKTKLSEEVAHKFSNMIVAAEKEGICHFLLTSGFRDFDEQNALYNKMGSDYALPAGYSEHNLGLSLDVGSTQMKMDEASEGKWIEENAWKYGFILRYPKDKTDVTGIKYEPWHIRYVGLPHSAIMKEKNLVLEEYLAYLKEEKNISVSVNGKKYKVSYYPISQNTTIKVPNNHHYEISGNNMDGVIVTVFP